MNVIQVPLDMIDVGERLREIDEDYAALIAASFQEDGQRAPIEVRASKREGGKWRLIAGAHRVRAAEIADLKVLSAVVLTVSDAHAELLEIDENLMRHELTPLDRSVFLAMRKEVWERLHPQTKHGGDRKSDQFDRFDNLIQRFSREAADKLGLSEAVVQRAVRRFKAIAPDVRKSIAGTWIARSGSQLDKLARLEPAMQREVARIIKSTQIVDRVEDVGEIMRMLTRTPRPDVATSFEKFLSVWRKADQSSRQQIVDHLHAEGVLNRGEKT